MRTLEAKQVDFGPGGALEYRRLRSREQQRLVRAQERADALRPHLQRRVHGEHQQGPPGDRHPKVAALFGGEMVCVDARECAGASEAEALVHRLKGTQLPAFRLLSDPDGHFAGRGKKQRARRAPPCRGPNREATMP